MNNLPISLAIALVASLAIFNAAEAAGGCGRGNTIVCVPDRPVCGGGRPVCGGGRPVCGGGRPVCGVNRQTDTEFRRTGPQGECGSGHHRVCGVNRAQLNANAAALDCGDGFSRAPSGKCYRLMTQQPASWFDAKTSCEQLSGNLASVTSMTDQAFIEELIGQQGYTGNLWLSGRRVGQTWYWFPATPQNTPVPMGPLFYWAPTDPDAAVNDCGDTQLCVQLWNSANYQWDDDFCYYRKGYVCERV